MVVHKARVKVRALMVVRKARVKVRALMVVHKAKVKVRALMVVRKDRVKVRAPMVVRKAKVKDSVLMVVRKVRVLGQDLNLFQVRRLSNNHPKDKLQIIKRKHPTAMRNGKKIWKKNSVVIPATDVI
jgi:hypothetical protein